MHKERIFIPGPTPVPSAVQAAMLTPMTNHRGQAAEALWAELTDGLRRLWHGAGPVAILPASGTGGLEALVTNALARGKRVLMASAGAFGDRFGTVAERAGLAVDWVRAEWGRAIDPDDVARAVRSRRYDALLLTQNETSTGVAHPVREIVAAARPHVPLVFVDAISGCPAMPLELDGWGIDAVVLGSQKGLMLPPGLALVGLAAGVAERFDGTPSVYWDLAPYWRGALPYTPALSLWYGLAESLALLEEEGEDARWRRHRTMSVMVRRGAAALGFHPAAEERWASPTVTALRPPTGIEASALLRTLRSLGVVFAGGQGPWRGQVVRVGHVGAVAPIDVVGAMAALEGALAALDGRPVTGRAAAAATVAWHDGRSGEGPAAGTTEEVGGHRHG